MVTVAKAEEEICDKMAEILAGEGFQKADRFLLVKHRNAEASWQLRFGARADRTSKQVLFTLLAGLRFEGIAKLLEEDDEDGNAPVISVPTHFLHEDRSYVEWSFDRDDIIDVLLNEIRVYVIPFFIEFESKQNLRDALSDADPRSWLSLSKDSRIEILIALLASEGRSSEAISLLDAELKARVDKPPGHRYGLENLRRRICRLSQS